MTPKDFFEFAKKNNAKMVDLKFVDLLGTWQHCSYPIDTWDEGTFKDGLGFDGSSIRGWPGRPGGSQGARPAGRNLCRARWPIDLSAGRSLARPVARPSSIRGAGAKDGLSIKLKPSRTPRTTFPGWIPWAESTARTTGVPC